MQSRSYLDDIRQTPDLDRPSPLFERTVSQLSKFVAAPRIHRTVLSDCQRMSRTCRNFGYAR